MNNFDNNEFLNNEFIFKLYCEITIIKNLNDDFTKQIQNFDWERGG